MIPTRILAMETRRRVAHSLLEKIKPAWLPLVALLPPLPRSPVCVSRNMKCRGTLRSDSTEQEAILRLKLSLASPIMNGWESLGNGQHILLYRRAVRGTTTCNIIMVDGALHASLVRSISSGGGPPPQLQKGRYVSTYNMTIWPRGGNFLPQHTHTHFECRWRWDGNCRRQKQDESRQHAVLVVPWPPPSIDEECRG